MSRSERFSHMEIHEHKLPWLPRQHANYPGCWLASSSSNMQIDKSQNPYRNVWSEEWGNACLCAQMFCLLTMTKADWHQCWVSGQYLRLKLWQFTVSDSCRHETCLKHKEKHMLPWLLQTCFLCFLCCTNKRGNFSELLFCSHFIRTEILVLILLSEGLRSALLMPNQMWYLRMMTRSGLREPIADQLIFRSDHGTSFMLE